MIHVGWAKNAEVLGELAQADQRFRCINSP
jgi:hypothetical protein